MTNKKGNSFYFETNKYSWSHQGAKTANRATVQNQMQGLKTRKGRQDCRGPEDKTYLFIYLFIY